MKKNIIMLLMYVFLTAQSHAFHSVSEILPNGKVLICKDADQVRENNIVNVYKRKSPGSKSDKTMVKTREFLLPENGQKIKFMQKDFKFKNRYARFEKVDELGVATVTDETLEGDDRVVYLTGKSRSNLCTEKNRKISRNEAMEIQRNCLVAIPDRGGQVIKNALVSW